MAALAVVVAAMFAAAGNSHSQKQRHQYEFF
jgi:hypothetical protein